MMDDELMAEVERERRESNRRNICPACGRDKSNFITTTFGEGSWSIECKCGELIDED